MEIHLACNDRNLFFSEEENSTNVNKYYVQQAADADASTVDDYVRVLSQQIPAKSRVLDVGCAQGKFGRILAAKECVLYAVDINRASIEFVNSAGYYHTAFVCDVTRPDSEEFQRLASAEKFDVIILSDILEHLADPTSVLLHLYPLLRENGSFLVGVPNIANLDICFNLLEGRFHYSSMGILDNTHLKFFTKESFLQWIELIGEVHPEQKLYCAYLGSSYYESAYIKEIKEKYPQLFSIAAQRPEYNAFQLFFRLDRSQKNQSSEPEGAICEPTCVVADLGDALQGKVVQDRQVAMAPSERELLIDKISKKDAWIAKQEEFLQYREAQLQEKEKAVADQAEVIAAQTEVSAAQTEAIAEKDAWIAKQEEFLKYREAQLQEKEKAIADQAEVIAAQTEVSAAQTEAIAEKDAWIAKQEEFLKYREAQLQEKERAILQLQEALRACQEQLAQKEDVIVDQTDTIEQLRVELELVKKRLSEIENSRIWRFTRFLHD